jgi:glutaminase
MGTFSPLLDSHGNSVRGLKVCEALSSHFDLHMLNRSADVRTSVIADYETARFATRRNRAPHERKIIEERHHDVRVLELVGALSFATIDYVTRQLADKPPAASLLILDCRRVPAITEAGARLLGEHFGRLAAAGTTVIVAGVDKASGVFEAICSFVAASQLRRFDSLDEAIEWAEDQIVYRYGGFSGRPEAVGLADQPLLAGLSKKEIATLTARSVERSYEAGARIVASGEPARSVFFLESGNVSVKMPSGVRLASFAPGVSFGEMAMIEPHRSADVFADTAVKCLELPLAALGEEGARVTTQILRNLASLLARRLILANAKVDLLSGFSD